MSNQDHQSFVNPNDLLAGSKADINVGSFDSVNKDVKVGSGEEDLSKINPGNHTNLDGQEDH